MSRMLQIERLVRTRIPTEQGVFELVLYGNDGDDKEHLALVLGDVTQPDVLVRVHSECFTGDVLGSLRCDCGEQLSKAMEQVARENAGIILYLRQEGRGIGLLQKLRAYNLQDNGYDTVDANLALGHEADERDYTIAAMILRDLGVPSVRLLTNNPAKIEGLTRLGITVSDQVTLQPTIHPENEDYLATKVNRMRHLLSLNGSAPRANGVHIPLIPGAPKPDRPFVTLTYAQTLNGTITQKRGQPTAISGKDSMRMTHQLRATHAGILVGIDTVIFDNPSLTVRLVDGKNPRPVVVDTHLRFPLTAKFLSRNPIILTAEHASTAQEQVLVEKGVEILRVPVDKLGRINLKVGMKLLKNAGISSLMVEGGAKIITSFLQNNLVDRVIVTVSPKFMEGLNAIDSAPVLPQMRHFHSRHVGEDLVVWGDVAETRGQDEGVTG